MHRFVFNKIKKIVPKISDSEMIALRSGTVSIDREIFRGKIDYIQYNKTINQTNVFDVKKIDALLKLYPNQFVYPTKTHNELFNYLGKNKFFSMLIPEKYGGLKTSVSEMSNRLTYIATANPSLSVITMVPNSLGPAELLLNYGTDYQKNKYLPQLANGDKIPCFGLTGPNNGSDATGSIDKGHIIKDSNGNLAIDIKINKRYITLAPVANLIGLAFSVEDPNKLLGKKIDKSNITVALIESNHKNLIQGNYHNPLDCGFPNGTLSGHIQIPIENVIGGEKNIGEGWKMLMECLAAGRGISLPATAQASSKVSALLAYHYAKHRIQFKLPLLEMEAIQNKVCNIFIKTNAIQSSIYVTNKILDQGHKPSVISAVMKERTTELAREILNDAMDIHAGGAICKGPNNILEKFYKSAPIGITVEGSNTLTKNLIIFGQGLNKSHPYISDILISIQNNDINSFNKLMKSATKNALYLYFSSLYHYLFQYNNNLLEVQTMYFACLSNFIALQGGKIKQLQSLSADMAHIFSNLYIAHCVQIYQNEHQISQTLCDLTIRNLLIENQSKINNIISNIWYCKLLLPFMKKNYTINYDDNRKLTHEIKTNDKITKDLLNHVYIDQALEDLIQLDNYDLESKNYKNLYDKVISVAEYKL